MSKSLYSSLLYDLRAQGIAYAVLRDDPECPRMRDFDVLIDRERSADFVARAQHFGFQLLKSGRTNPGKKVLLHWDAEEPRIIDLHEGLIYRGYEYLDGQRVLARRLQVNGYDRLSPEDELLTLLWHNILGKGEIQAKHRERLAALWQTPMEEEYLLDHLRGYGLDQLFLEIRQNFPTLAQAPLLVAEMKKRALRRLRFRPWSNPVRLTRLAVGETFKEWVGARRGALIAFIGPDGCGKSSLTNTLREEFRRATIATDIVYLGPWGQNNLPLYDLVRIFHLKPFYKEEKNKRDFNKKMDVPPSRRKRMLLFVRGSLFYAILAVELWFRYWTKVLPRLRRGRIVLADRYIYDLLIGYKNRPLRHFKRLRAWLCRHYPSPDVIILLDAPPEVIFKRKPQFKVDQLEYIRGAYQALGQDFKLYKLDTSVSLEKTLEDFHREIPQLLWKRWKA